MAIETSTYEIPKTDISPEQTDKLAFQALVSQLDDAEVEDSDLASRYREFTKLERRRIKDYEDQLDTNPALTKSARQDRLNMLTRSILQNRDRTSTDT